MRKTFVLTSTLLVLAGVFALPAFAERLESQSGVTNTEFLPISTDREVPINMTEVRTRVKELRERSRNPMTKEEREEKIRTLREATRNERCALVRTNVEARKELYSANRDRYAANYTRMLANINNALTRFDQLEYDTSDVRGLLNQLELEVIELRSLQRELTQIMSNLSEVACTAGETEGAKREKPSELAEAQAKLKEIREQTQKINTMFREQILTELKELRSQFSDEARPDSN